MSRSTAVAMAHGALRVSRAATPPSLGHEFLVVLPALLVAVAFGAAIAFVIVRVVRALNTRHANEVRTAALRRLRAPFVVALPLLAMLGALHFVRLTAEAQNDLHHVIALALVALAAWALARSLEVIEDLVLAFYDVGSPDNLKARRLQTQIRVFRRVLVVVIALVAVAIGLYSIPSVRLAGAGLLASAGVVSIIAGIASKPVASNMIAGIQIALAQPIRLDDVVVIEGHWGRIEEISLTYVVVRVWDLRRLVLPISYFVTNSFENWTKNTADILGIVHMEVDYTAPVGVIREEFLEILASSPDWDGQVARLQVTQLGVSTMQLRFVMSSSDSSRSWNLQCELREKMIKFLQEHYPEVLPRVRAEMLPSLVTRPPAPGNGTLPAGEADPGGEWLAPQQR